MEETVKKRNISSKNLAEKSYNLSAKTLLKNDAERVASIQQLQEAIKVRITCKSAFCCCPFKTCCSFLGSRIILIITYAKPSK